jgi:hypothetical protein
MLRSSVPSLSQEVTAHFVQYIPVFYVVCRVFLVSINRTPTSIARHISLHAKYFTETTSFFSCHGILTKNNHDVDYTNHGISFVVVVVVVQRLNLRPRI